MPTSKRGSASTASRQRAIQDDAEQKRQAKPKQSVDAKSKPEPTSQRDRPQNPLPKQHQSKPGIESELDPRPQFLETCFRGAAEDQPPGTFLVAIDVGLELDPTRSE